MEYILRRKTIISILFILTLFFIRELTAFSSGDAITLYCDEMLSKHTSGGWYYFFSTIKAIFNSGSPQVILTTFIAIGLFSLLKFTEIKDKQFGWKQFSIFLLAITASTFTIFFIFNPRFISSEKSHVIDPQKSMELFNKDTDLKERNSNWEYGYAEENSIEKYEEITILYEEKQKTKLRKKISETFRVPLEKLTDDELLGYVVASYFGLEKFDTAAILILERNKNYPIWNHQLKLDLARTIRYFSLQNGVSVGNDFVDTLKKKYKANILSNLWTSIPYGYVYSLEQGVHNNHWRDSKIDKGNVRSVLKKYPDDKFCSYGYYFLNDYANSLSCNPDSRIRDVLLYASAYEAIKEIYKDESQNESFFDPYSFLPRKPTGKSKRVLEAMQHLELFISEYKNSVHYDDALFWLAWLHGLNHEYERSIATLNKINLEETDYFRIIIKYRRLIFSKAPFLRKLLNKNKIASLVNNNYYGRYYFINSFPDLLLEDQIELIKSGMVDSTLFCEHLKYLYRSKNQFINWYDILAENNIDCSKYSPEYRVWSSNLKGKIYNEFIEEALDLKKNGKNSLCRYYLSKGLANYKKSDEREYIYYLLVRLSVDKFQPKVLEYLKIFKRHHHKSKYLDDIYAEAIFSSYITVGDEETGEKLLEEMLSRYNNLKPNALDNALYWAILYYYQKYSFLGNEESKGKLLKYYKKYQDLFPNSILDIDKKDIYQTFEYF